MMMFRPIRHTQCEQYSDSIVIDRQANRLTDRYNKKRSQAVVLPHNNHNRLGPYSMQFPTVK